MKWKMITLRAMNMPLLTELGRHVGVRFYKHGPINVALLRSWGAGAMGNARMYRGFCTLSAAISNLGSL